jgi:aspartyl-tRNA(Asn)/glutamyl-tRNA(Gln) amidotransferase subunit A
LSPVEVTSATLDRIERLNPLLNAYINVLGDSAAAAAKAAELQLQAGIDLGPLHGVPVSVKDNIRVRGTVTTAASRVLLGAQPDEEDATVVRRLRAAGAILIGKVNLHEFAFGAPDSDGPFGEVQNPRRLGFQTGASSSGSAAAVAAGLSVISLGTDTGGSIRQPASLCGLVGLKATYGLVPIRGVIPDSVHLDHVGPLARSVYDAAAALLAIAGHDSDDPYSVLSVVEDYPAAVGRDVRGLRLGLPSDPHFSFGKPEALDLVEQAQGTLARLGLLPASISLPRVEELEAIADVLITSDLAEYHEQYEDRRQAYGLNFLERTEAGRRATAVQYSRARQAQVEIRRQWLGLFERVDLLALPANLAAASPLGVDTVEVSGATYPTRAVTSRYGRLANLTGFPALAVPIGETEQGLPIGIQLVGPPFCESRLLAVGHALEHALGDLCGQWGIEPRGGP